MSTVEVGQEIQTINITREIEIAAPIEIAFEAMLEEIGPGGEMMDGKPFPMVIEPWPGGRWYRVSFVRILRAPLAKLDAFDRRMGLHAKWVSPFGISFNHDFQVSFTKEDMANGEAEYNYQKGSAGIEELSGLSVFTRDEAGNIYYCPRQKGKEHIRLFNAAKAPSNDRYQGERREQCPELFS